ncbi:MAG: UbiH/UbiF/VisC/COQ6 family ubiquinone biosynthesis hydroxylase [Actinomycetota bacterium]
MTAISPTAALSSSTLAVDVLVVGAGPVGGLLAAVLTARGVAVAVCEAATRDHLLRPGGDGRAIAVAYTAKRAFEAAGVWPLMEADAQPILDIRVTDGASPLFLHYDHHEVGDHPLGWIVDGSAIRRAVLDRLAGLGIPMLAPARLAGLARDGAGAFATLEDGRTVRAALVVGADGRGSATRRMAGIGVRRLDYGQSGIVCVVAHQRPHRGIAHEHFLPAGPFAILPMTGDRSGVVWTEASASATAIVAQSDDDFLAELSWRFGDFLGSLRLEGSRLAYPLSLQVAERTVDRRLALIGDAAHGMHPIAGQGMNMGIRDAAALAEVVLDARRLGLDVGGPAVLERFDRWRRFDNGLMLGMTDGLNRLFSNHIGPLKLVRDLGLAAVDRLPALKTLLMRHAMGLVGDLPRLLKGELP